MDKEKFKSKLENYWYYYKYHTIGVVALVITIVIVLQQCSTIVKPDLTVIVATQSTALSIENQSKFRTYFQSLTGDANKDGKKAVECDFFSFENSNTAVAQKSSLISALLSDEYLIYIFDDQTLKSSVGDQISTTLVKINDILPTEKLTDPYKLPIANTKLGKQAFAKNMAGFSIYVRTYNKNKSDKSNNANIDNAIDVIKKLAGQ